MIEIDTGKQAEVVDITSSVEKALAESKVQSGICLVYTLHTTTGITINEAEGGLIQDIMRLMAALVPEGSGYKHDRLDGNATAHLRAVLLGNSAVIPIEKGMLVLGTWQRILFIEQDGPRHRRVYVKAIPD
ncbi:MAG: secondary thiamine-phosphate synthase enzyme YjbQ [Methanotrichaceae archaeon]